MKHILRVCGTLVVLVLLSVIPVSVQGAASPNDSPAPIALDQTVQGSSETASLWFVEMASAPTADGTNLNTVRQEKVNFRNAARGAGLNFTERYAFDTLWNGLSIQMNASQLSTLARIDGVKAIYPVVTVAIPPTAPGNPELFTALAMTGANIAQSELGFTGKGIKVAVMDTGIDVNHPDLGGNGVAELDSAYYLSNTRIKYGYDFVGNAYNADPSSLLYNPTPAPDPNPDDCNGHGSHVAGIIGANGTVKGVAPEVTFGAYRVFGCEGSTTADIMIAAMERALADGMQVLNMSIGSSFQWPQYPTAMASNRLVNKGMVVVASIGNSGASGVYAAGAPGLGDKVIGVASFDNTRLSTKAFSISPDNRLIGYVNATAAPPAPLSGGGAMARTGTQTSTADACAALAPGSLAGKIALIRRGTCGFYVKAFNAQSAGAIAVVLYNNAPGSVNPTVAGSPAITIPVVMASQADGNLIDSRLAAGSVTLTWTAQTVSTPVTTAGLISSFSSYGLSPDLSLKPDIGAPGGNIWSSYPLEKGGYANLSGTSMASPHVAGAVALLLQAKPNTPSQIVRTILQNSAEPRPRTLTSADLDNVHRQGAGLLHIDTAILATTKIEPGKLSLGEGQAGPAARTLSIENNSNSAVTYDLSYVNALSTGGVITPSFVASNATVTFNTSSVTVPAKGKASVTATINPATTPQYGQYGGYIVFTPRGGGQVYRVPFAGFVGDYQSIVALAPTANGFPWLAKLVGANYVRQVAGATFTFTSGNVPQILVHLDHQVRRLRVEVFEANTNKAWHRALEMEYVGRNSTATSFFAFPWDGTTKGGNKSYTVPDGQYYFKLSVLKALGDDNNPAHWETWTSPTFAIDRP